MQSHKKALYFCAKRKRYMYKEKFIMSGIVRRIDELGRIVIPKELRRTMRIRNGEELEMCQLSESEIVIKKFSQLQALQNMAKGYAQALSDLCELQIIIVDKGKVLAHSGGRTDKTGEIISNTLFQVLQEKKQSSKADNLHITKNDHGHYEDIYVYPLVSSGNLYGGIIAVGKINEEIKNNVKTAGCCLVSQL